MLRVINPDTGRAVFGPDTGHTIEVLTGRDAPSWFTGRDHLGHPTVCVRVSPSYRPGLPYDLATYPATWIVDDEAPADVGSGPLSVKDLDLLAGLLARYCEHHVDDDAERAGVASARALVTATADSLDG